MLPVPYKIWNAVVENSSPLVHGVSYKYENIISRVL